MLCQVALTRHFGGSHCHVLLALVSIFAKFRIRGPARCVGLDDEANVFPSTGGDGGGHFFNIPRGRSGNTRADSTLMPGHTPLALGTHGSYMDTVRGAGGPVSATSRGLGTPRGHFRTTAGWAEGPTGTSPDDWYQCSTPHGSPPITSFAPPASREFAGHPLACNPCLPFSSRPLYESSRLADPPPKLCATPGIRVLFASWGPLFIKPYPH